MSTTPLKDGVYIITNFKQRNSVFLENPDDETPLRGHYRQDNLSERWQVTDRGNGQHSIRNVGFQRYANSGTLAGLDAFVEGRDREQLWYIQERSKGKHTIATTDSGNYWMLPDNQLSTPVGLLDKPSDQRCWWIFTDPETEDPVDGGASPGAVLFELKKLPIVPFSPLQLDFVIIQEMSDDSVSNATRSIGEICRALVSSTRQQPDTLRVNIIEFESFESSAIFFRRFTGFLPVERLCNAGDPDISWQKCRGSSLPEMAIRGLRAEATSVAILNLNSTLLQQCSQATIKFINGLVKQNITLIFTPIQPTFYDSNIFRELQNLSFEFQPFEQMDEFTDYVFYYNEMVALPRFIEYPELRVAIIQAMPRVVELIRGGDHDAQSSAITALSRLAEHAELHDTICQAMHHIMELLKDEDRDARLAAVAALSKLAEHGKLSNPGYNAADEASKGNFQVVDAIPRDSSGRTPLSWAAGSGYEAVVRMLVVFEGDINTKDNNGRTPLLWAAANGHDTVVCLLLEKEGVNVSAKDKNGRTPLSWAAAGGHNKVVRLLLAHKNTDVDAKSNIGLTPLSSAAGAGHDEVVKLLLAQKGVNVNSKGKRDDTPLMQAAFNGHSGVVRLLMAHKDVDVDAKQDKGWTPLSVAAVKGHDEVVKLLLAQKGVDINSKDNAGQTPLSLAAQRGRDEVVRLLLAHKDVDVNAKRKHFDFTPLSLAAMGGRDGVVRLLLAHKDVDVNAEQHLGWTPLLLAAEEGHGGVVHLLLAHSDVDVNAKQYLGRTPLSLAAEKGHSGVVHLLLAHIGIDINAEDNTGRTPLSWATEKEHHEVARMLRIRIRQRPVNNTWFSLLW